MTDTSQRLFLYGPGYTARALAKIWPGAVLGTYRSDQGRAALEALGIAPVPVSDPEALRAATSKAHVVISAPPEETGCPAFQSIGAFACDAASLTYLSTTGVYGDLSGGWAMEWTPPNPQSNRAIRRYHAELAWQDEAERVRLVRLPGIYGPGRSAFDRLRRGQARRVVKPGHVFSRAHVEDIAGGLNALLTSETYGAFNLCDDLAAPPQDIIAFAAALVGQEPPPELPIEQADLSPMGLSFYGECKRVSNARLKAATGWRPIYPTYRDGLTAILKAEG